MQNKIALLLVIVLSIMLSACSLAESDTTLNQYGTSNTTPIYFTFANGDTVIMSANYTFGLHSNTHESGGSDQIKTANFTSLLVTGATITNGNITSNADVYIEGGDLLRNSGALRIKLAGDTDDYFTLNVVGDIPTIYGTGAYIRFGDAGLTGHLTPTEDDVLFTGNVEIDGTTYFDGIINADAQILQIDADDVWSGLRIRNDNNSTAGAGLELYHQDSTPVNSTYLSRIYTSGYNNVLEKTNFANLYVVTTNITDGNESADFVVNLINNGSGNVAMILSSNGTLSVDAGYSTFDQYDDVLLLRKGIQENDKQALIDIGVMHEVPVYNTEQQFIGYNTMIDLQAFNRLIAGAIYQQDNYIKTLEARILALEERIK